jgi:hypothetical protein
MSVTWKGFFHGAFAANTCSLWLTKWLVLALHWKHIFQRFCVSVKGVSSISCP